MCEAEVVIGVSLLRVLLYGLAKEVDGFGICIAPEFFSPFLYERSNLSWVEGLFGLCELKSYFVEYRSG